MITHPKTPWRTAPISRTCEVSNKTGMCGCVTVCAYPAYGHGWMALCAEHGERHAEATPIEKLLSKGETLAP